MNKLCNKAIWLNKGSIQKQGIATRITSAYADFLRAKMDRSSQEKEPGLDKIDSGASILIKAITLNGQTGPITLKYREDLNIVLEFESFGERPFWVALGIKRNDELLCHAVSMARDISRPLKGKGTGKVLLSYRSLPLMHGQYVAVGFIFDESGLHCYHTLDSAPFTIIPPVQWRQEQGLMDLDHEWKILRDLK